MLKFKKVKGVAAAFLGVLFFLSTANAALFTASVESVEPFDIAGLTVWLDVQSDFIINGSISKGNAVPNSWFADSNIGSIVNEETSRVAKFGYVDFMAALGNPLTPLKTGELFSFDYSGNIKGLFLAKFSNLAAEDLFGGDIQLKSFNANGVSFAPVPIPPALLLFGSGLIGLVGLRRKIKK